MMVLDVENAREDELKDGEGAMIELCLLEVDLGDLNQ